MSKYIDKGITYIPIKHNTSQEEIDKLIQDNKSNGRTIVFLRSGNHNIKNILKELIKTTINS